MGAVLRICGRCIRDSGVGDVHSRRVRDHCCDATAVVMVSVLAVVRIAFTLDDPGNDHVKV